jgi:hypothetical protein
MLCQKEKIYLNVIPQLFVRKDTKNGERQAVGKKVSFVGTFYIEEQLEIAPLDLKSGLHSSSKKKKNSAFPRNYLFL